MTAKPGRVRRLITPGGKERTRERHRPRQVHAERHDGRTRGYLAATQTRDGNVQLISSKNHYVFNLAWLKQLPTIP